MSLAAAVLIGGGKCKQFGKVVVIALQPGRIGILRLFVNAFVECYRNVQERSPVFGQPSRRKSVNLTLMDMALNMPNLISMA